MEKTYKTWLLLLGLFLAVFGSALALWNQSPLFDWLFNRHIDPVFWPDGISPDKAAAFQRWIYGVLGATCAGWGVLLAFWARWVLQAARPWAWWGLVAGLGVWYLLDTGLSLQAGVLFNAGFNTLFAVLYAIPLLGLRKTFLA